MAIPHRSILLEFCGPPIKQKVAGLTDRFLGIVHIWDHLECSNRKNKATFTVTTFWGHEVKVSLFFQYEAIWGSKPASTVYYCWPKDSFDPQMASNRKNKGTFTSWPKKVVTVKVASFFRLEHSKWSQICTMPKNLCKCLAQWLLDPGPQYSGRTFLWGVAIGSRRQNSIAQHFFSMACPTVHWLGEGDTTSRVDATKQIRMCKLKGRYE